MNELSEKGVEIWYNQFQKSEKISEVLIFMEQKKRETELNYFICI